MQGTGAGHVGNLRTRELGRGRRGGRRIEGIGRWNDHAGIVALSPPAFEDSGHGDWIDMMRGVAIVKPLLWLPWVGV